MQSLAVFDGDNFVGSLDLVLSRPHCSLTSLASWFPNASLTSLTRPSTVAAVVVWMVARCPNYWLRKYSRRMNNVLVVVICRTSKRNDEAILCW